MTTSSTGGSRGDEQPLAPHLGRVFEDFAEGQLYRHALGRTVTSTDNIWFTLLTVNPNPIHFDAVWASKTEWGKPLMNSAFTLALVTGLSVDDLSKNAVNLGWDKVRLPHPVFEGDTIYAQSTVLSTRASASRPHQGIVTFQTEGFNQDGTVVIVYERTILIYRRGHAPPRPQPPTIQRTR
jgi:acyl dehydratase